MLAIFAIQSFKTIHAVFATQEVIARGVFAFQHIGISPRCFLLQFLELLLCLFKAREGSIQNIRFRRFKFFFCARFIKEVETFIGEIAAK